MHVVVYLPDAFYSAIASTLVETLQAVNRVRGENVFSFEFVSRKRVARSMSGIAYPVKLRPSRKMDVLVLLTGVGPDVVESIRVLEQETQKTRSLIFLAQKQGALIAATCGASFMLASLGLLDGRKATISWWLKKRAKAQFPKVHWEPSRIVIRDGKFYTTGAAFAGLELIGRLLIDLGFGKEERRIRKLMVLPPTRESQNPYEIPGVEESTSFERRLQKLAQNNLAKLSIAFLVTQLKMSQRTLTRRFHDELQATPGKWIQEQRLERARTLLESTNLSVSEICFRAGYRDVPSFGRLFTRALGMTPGKFRREARPAP